MATNWNEQCSYRYYLCGITVGCNHPLGTDIPLSESKPDTCIVFRKKSAVHEPLSADIASDDCWHPIPEQVQAEGWLREDGRIALLATSQTGPDHWFFQIRQIIPFLAGLQGQLVLHASAVQADGNVYAFVGESGAGKSTLAKALAVSGTIPVADDLLAVACDHRNPVAFTAGTDLCPPQQVPLCSIFFLSRANTLDQPTLEQIHAKQFLVLLFRHGFSEMSIHRLWTFQFELYGKLVREVTAFNLVMPDSLTLLPEAASQVYLQLRSRKSVSL